MKKFIVILGILLTGIMVMSSCRTQKKCPAYGHHTYYETIEADNNQS